jgi:cytochrome c-type protein NapC
MGENRDRSEFFSLLHRVSVHLNLASSKGFDVVRKSLLLASLLSLALSVPLMTRAAEPDWAKVKGRDITLFYPATMSWERLFTPRFHSGQTAYKEGTKNCVNCHGDLDEAEMGKHLVKAGGFIEPKPIADKPPSVKANVKVAHDADNFYVRVEFDPGAQPNAGMDKDFATKVAFMFDDGSVPEAARAGCWIGCHANLASMSGPTITATKYLAETRTNMSLSGGDKLLDDAGLAALRAKGHVLEYWQARIKPDGSVSTVDGTVLEKRAEHPKALATSTAVKTGSTWAVTFARKKAAGAGYKEIVPGKTYTFSIALHAGHAAQRYHYVGLERKFVLDTGKADLVANLQK